MKNTIVTNTEYWKTVPADRIIGRNAFPDAELFAHIAPDATILDLGCGTGEMAEFLSGHGYAVTGIDINAEAIEQNKARATRVQYVTSDVTERLPFADGTFDAIVISFVLVNVLPLTERERLVSEITRIVKPGGIVWVNEGLVSDDYAKRYTLCAPFLENDHDFFVFAEGTTSVSIQTHDDLQQAITDNKIARVAHHFTAEELQQLFHKYSLQYELTSAISSPHSKSIIIMATMVFKKKS